MKALFIGGTGTISADVVELAQQRGWRLHCSTEVQGNCPKACVVSLPTFMMRKL